MVSKYALVWCVMEINTCIPSDCRISVDLWLLLNVVAEHRRREQDAFYNKFVVLVSSKANQLVHSPTSYVAMRACVRMCVRAHANV